MRPATDVAIPGAEAVAIGFRYPDADAAGRLLAAVEGVPAGPVRRHFEDFVDRVTDLDPSRWEELHTATLDLGPRFAPYVGHAIWADNYQRGVFMAELAAAQQAVGVDAGGELPDHIEPVLRYLAVAEEPLSELVEILPAALRSMEQSLARSEPENPYRSLLLACIALTDDRPRLAGAAHRPPPRVAVPSSETVVWVRNTGSST